MHELSIASSIVETVIKEAAKNKAKAVTKIALEIGALSDIVPESLRFGFEAISKDTILEKTELDIKIISILGNCKGCQKEFEIESYTFVCPACQSRDIEMTKGTELDIAFIEIEKD